ncbi:tyrosine-type recombinase/integrase [Flavobacterium celericrescens]|uniref:Tyrosine-type recombinase/integrase n=1 Tax=Flavobacterium celericrescens TaxID=2709780 RepID=A0ABX0IFZ5_9FLAO|nr:tyrosine-type recombinase/integrase [Flavobacterium celericrescens]NHM04572.1 tyrosine-type recombinase/integrase [Flavobacterium celericrescens]
MDSNIKAYQDYLIKEKNYSPLTVQAYIADVLSFQQYLQDSHETILMEEVIYSQIRSWIVVLVENNISNTSINRKISSLKSFYKFLLKCKQISVNPLLKHKSLKTAKKVQIPFSEKELQDVFELNSYPNDFEGIRNQLIIELFYTTGMRRAEMINLSITNVDLLQKTIKVIGKRNKERIIPLLDCTIRLIELYKEQRNHLEVISNNEMLILSKTGNKVSESFVYRLINEYFSTVSQKTKKSPHVLRHSFATHLLNNGADLNSVKELLGHASLSSTQIYTHSSLAELKKVYQEAHPRNK